MPHRYYSETKISSEAKHSFDSQQDFEDYTKRRLIGGLLEPLMSKGTHTKTYSPKEDMESHRFEVVILSPKEYSDLLLYKTIFESLNVNHQSLIDYFKEER